MSYTVKEIFYTLQGEGANTGRPAVFCRFAGCNLWSGLEGDRSSAACTFCDTNFVGTRGPGGGKFSGPAELADAIRSLWPVETTSAPQARPFVVCTGGEPLLQLDDALVRALHDRDFLVAVETNGTLPAPTGIDWICVSPKGRTPLQIVTGDELKLIYPQADAVPATFESLKFTHHFLQPMDGPNASHHVQATVQYCLAHPQWRLSLQTHKLIGIP